MSKPIDILGIAGSLMFPINQPEVMIGNAAKKFDADGNLTDQETAGFIRQLLQNLVDWTNRLSTK